MYKNKKDVDKYVEKLLSKLPAKEVSRILRRLLAFLVCQGFWFANFYYHSYVKFYDYNTYFQFKSRAYSVARLYFEVGDYDNCQIHVEQYLTQKDNNAAAYKLLGQALQKMGHKEKALEQFKISLDTDQTQTGTILDSE